MDNQELVKFLKAEYAQSNYVGSSETDRAYYKGRQDMCAQALAKLGVYLEVSFLQTSTK